MCNECGSFPCMCKQREFVATLLRPPGEGWKDDLRGTENEKDRWDLLPIGPVREIVKVLTIGARKYKDWNWTKVPEARDRYYAAIWRHIIAYRSGEAKDQETGLHHLAHAGACVLFLLWFDQEAQK